VRARGHFVLVLVSALMLSACTGDDEPTIETATVRSGEVVQTVQAPAQLDAVDRAELSAPLGGEVDQLLVGDGDLVEAGDALVRLASDSLDAQVAQAEAAVASAEELGAASAGAGFDLSPVLGAFRGQLDTVFPALIETLGSQLETTESTLAAAIAGVEETTRATDEVGRDVQAALAEAQATLDALRLEGLDLDDAEVDLDLPKLDLPELDLPEPELPELELPGSASEGPGGAQTAGITAALRDAQASAADARRQLRDTELAFRSASQQLLDAERDLESQADATAAAQAAAVDAQVEQAQLALDATRSRIDELVVVAPIDGVVELARGGGGGAPGLEGLPADLGDLAGGLGGQDALDGAGDLGELLGGGVADGATDATDGPIADGVEVGAGQPLLSVFDLSGFVARVEVDEIDVVQVEEGQAVTVRVDAFPGVELQGRVDHVALAPSRDVIGGALYPVTVVLTGVPEDLALRVGLTASTEIEVRRLEGDTVVPTSALLRRGDAEVVHVVRDGIAVEVPVELLAIGDEDAAITGEVSTGEEVVTTGVELIADGDEVPT
jgi:multidrug efflux pump subunit AcrA (membrane-fusion protein)